MFHLRLSIANIASLSLRNSQQKSFTQLVYQITSTYSSSLHSIFVGSDLQFSRNLSSLVKKPLVVASSSALIRNHKRNNNNHLQYFSEHCQNTVIITRQVAFKRRSLQVSKTPLADHFKMEWPKITLFGDSITRRSTDPDNGCWGSLISYKVGSFFEVNSRGFEGYNSKWGLELMPKLFPKSYLEKVDIFIPFFGHNDSFDLPFPAHLPVDQFEKNMEAMIKYLTENGLEKRKIIMITPTWFHLESFTKWLASQSFPPVTKQLDEAKKYSEAILRIATKNGIDVVDFFEISSKQEPLEEIFCDGVHYSRKGARVLFDALMPIIEKKIETTYKKPLADLWHAVPFDQHPEVKPLLDELAAKMKSGQT